eukprot:UN02818
MCNELCSSANSSRGSKSTPKELILQYKSIGVSQQYGLQQHQQQRQQLPQTPFRITLDLSIAKEILTWGVAYFFLHRHYNSEYWKQHGFVPMVTSHIDLQHEITLYRRKSEMITSLRQPWYLQPQQQQEQHQKQLYDEIINNAKIQWSLCNVYNAILCNDLKLHQISTPIEHLQNIKLKNRLLQLQQATSSTTTATTTTMNNNITSNNIQGNNSGGASNELQNIEYQRPLMIDPQHTIVNWPWCIWYCFSSVRSE